MNASAKFRRVVVATISVLIVTAFSSCSHTTASRAIQTPNTDSTSEGTVAAETASNEAAAANQEAANNDAAALAETQPMILANAQQDSIGLQLVEARGTDSLVIETPGTTAEYKVSKLASPPRLVVDLLNVKSKLNRNFDTGGAQYVSGVRVGSHPDRSRIVIDLNNSEGVEHKVDAEDGRLVVTLGTPSADAQTVARLQEEPAAPVAENNQAAEQLAAIEHQDAVETTPQTDTLAQATTAPRVVGLSIENMGAGSNVLVADMTNTGDYRLKRTAPSEYVLTLPETELDEAASQTIVAPPESGGIRSVRPVQNGKELLLRIFAKPGVSLRAKRGTDKIVVSAADGEEGDIRAQAAPDKAETPITITAKGDEQPKTEGLKAEGAAATNPPAEDEDSGLAALEDSTTRYVGRQISLDLQDTDIDNALRIIAEVSNLNIIASDDVTGKVTLRLIDVPWDQALDVILKTNGLDKVQEGNVIRIAPVEKLRQEREALKSSIQAAEELEPLQVKYIRISYAKASELKPLVESVISERGSVAYDERTNQLIIKDIGKGLKNVSTLVAKLDLRTPQVLIETQIVEASRSLVRDLGARFGFSYVQSPETGNATGNNFPNTIGLDGSNISNFLGTATTGIGLTLGSADGSTSVNAFLSAQETEGRVRVISRPAVSTTNNKQATIKSIRRIRVKTPSGGVSVATGQGAAATGSSAVATEQIEVGIVLEVTPQASPDYFVLLDINAKSSTLDTQTVVDGIPGEVERSTNSNVLVSSGQTFVLGGIYKITDNDNVAGLPFFKDIPVFGTLFRQASVNNSDEELLFFLTPRIIEGSFDDATMKASS